MSSHYFEKNEEVEIKLSTGELIRGKVIGYEKIGFDWPYVWVECKVPILNMSGDWNYYSKRRFKVSGKQVTKVARLEELPWEESKQAHAPGGVETI
jgi:hypothetical protein